jgi:hypothetical protein
MSKASAQHNSIQFKKTATQNINKDGLINFKTSPTIQILDKNNPSAITLLLIQLHKMLLLSKTMKRMYDDALFGVYSNMLNNMHIQRSCK